MLNDRLAIAPHVPPACRLCACVVRLDHRSRARRWKDAVAELAGSCKRNTQHGWKALPDNLPRQRYRRGTTGDLRSRPDRTAWPSNATRLRKGLTASSQARLGSTCTGGSTGTPRAPLRQPLAWALRDARVPRMDYRHKSTPKGLHVAPQWRVNFATPIDNLRL